MINVIWMSDSVIVGRISAFSPLLVRSPVVHQPSATVSPRHVPDEIVEIREVPRTLNGKKLEVPIKRLLMGVPQARAVNPGTLANPEALKDVLSAARIL